MTESIRIARKAVGILNENKADDVIILDVAENFKIANYFVIATAQSNPHLDFLYKEVSNKLEDTLEIESPTQEGTPDQGWILADFGDVLVHLFTSEKREYYDLEGLWADAEVISA